MSFYYTFADDDLLTGTKYDFHLANFRVPWSSQSVVFINFDVYPTSACSGQSDHSRSAPGFVPKSKVVDSNNYKLSTKTKILSDTNPDNYIQVEYTPGTGFSRSGSGEIMFSTPDWYDSSESTMMFNEVVDTTGMCESDDFTKDYVQKDRIFRAMRIGYSNMAPDVIYGVRPLIFRCFNFRNPIY
jgi:hypothetical protein